MKNTTDSSSTWQILKVVRITCIECAPADRKFVLKKIAKYSRSKKFYYTNPGYEKMQLVDPESGRLEQSDIYSPDYEHITDLLEKDLLDGADSGTFILEGIEEISLKLNYKLRNYHEKEHQAQIIFLSEKNIVPVNLTSIVSSLQFKIPDLNDIASYLKSKQIEQSLDFANACYGLRMGEIENLQNLDIESIGRYKTEKLAKLGLKIIPEPDVPEIGGLKALEADLDKIKVLFSPEAKQRGLCPPKAASLFGIPGTGKSLAIKTMGKRLNVPVVSCSWEGIMDTNLARSIRKLEEIFNIVDNIGNAIFAFDEFEKGITDPRIAQVLKAFLTWMQDHESPVMMVATINHVDKLPVEMFRRFEYNWFFSGEMHYGAMWSVFKIHLEKNFPGYHQKIGKEEWESIFGKYEGCTPAEIAVAVGKAHHELFYKNAHVNLKTKELIEEIISQRSLFEPAIKNRATSNALAKIILQAPNARPVSGPDTSIFAEPEREFLEPEPLLFS